MSFICQWFWCCGRSVYDRCGGRKHKRKAQCHNCPIIHSSVSPSQTHYRDISLVPSTCHSLLSWTLLERSWGLRVCPDCSKRQEWTWRNHCGPPVGLVSLRVMLFWLLTCLGTPGCVFMMAPGLNGLKGHLLIISSQRERERSSEWKAAYTSKDDRQRLPNW